MRALLCAVLIALLVPASAWAKELTGFTLCGPEGCRETDMTGFGHEDPFSGDAEAAPPGAYLTAALKVDGDSSWRMFYVPREGLLAFADGDAHTMRWMRPDPRLDTALKLIARGLQAYPGPRLRAVTIGAKRIEDGASSYLGLLGLRSTYADPGSGSGVRIRFETLAPSPWTEEELYYFPETEVVAGAGRWVRLPSSMAANVEAGKPLDAPAPSGWTRPVLAAVAAALGLVAIALLLLRRRSARGALAAPAASS